MTAQEIVLLLSVAVGSLILGACSARKELLEGVCSHWRAVILCIVSFFLSPPPDPSVSRQRLLCLETAPPLRKRAQC